MKRFELRDHTADVAVYARGDSLGEVYAAVADGLAAAMCDEIPDDGERISLSVDAESREALLFDYLDELIYLRDAREVLPVDNEAYVRRERAMEEKQGEPGENGAEDEPGEATEPRDRWLLEGSFRGVPFASVVARDVKAVTYSEMRIQQTDDGWEAYVVFDV